MTRRIIGALACALITVLATTASTPSTAAAQRREGRFGLALGWSRFMPTQPIASAEGGAPDYKLAGSSASLVDIDYWYSRWLGTRFSYQWLKTDLAEPDGPSFAKIYTMYLGALLSPGPIARSVAPFVTAGGALRRYDVSAIAQFGGQARQIAPRQNRPALYGGAGLAVRTPWIWVVPEAGVYANSFKHEAICPTCSNERDSQLDLVFSIKAQFR